MEFDGPHTTYLQNLFYGREAYLISSVQMYEGVSIIIVPRRCKIHSGDQPSVTFMTNTIVLDHPVADVDTTLNRIVK